MSAEHWVIVERRGDGVRRVSLEVLGKLASLGCEPVAVVAAAEAGRLAEAVAPFAPRVLALAHPSLHDAAGDVLCRILGELAAARAPRAIVAGATPAGRALCARLAVRLGAGYVADAVDLSLTEAGDLRAIRPVLGGRAYAEVGFLGTATRLLSVRPNAFPPAQPGAAGSIEHVALAGAAELDPSRARVTARRQAAATPLDLGEADVIVAGGRGLRGREGFAVVEQLAAVLGGAVGASRAAVDAGWRDHAAQIGKSGRTVSPKLFVALGISGAVHHRMGMDTARTVVVVNSDPAAPFFKHADYGLVGDLFQIAPALGDEIRRGREE
jgi:electron transfer flavoprotein alpha subunit